MKIKPNYSSKWLTFLSLFMSIEIQANCSTAWQSPDVSNDLSKGVLYVPIADSSVKIIPINDNGEAIVDLKDISNPRIQPMEIFDAVYKAPYDGYSGVRKSISEMLIKMLAFLPANLGIAYSEGFRSLAQQKIYFDAKFKEELKKHAGDKETAYSEASKSVSPFIDNIPTHCTGAAIDMTLFEITKGGQMKLIDMGKYDTIFGDNDAQETFSPNATMQQRKNRLILLNAAIKAGFVNYGYEYWHFSYGDKAYAKVKGNSNAIYGLVAGDGADILKIKKRDYLNSIQ